jgi:hypothetical protein
MLARELRKLGVVVNIVLAEKMRRLEQLRLTARTTVCSGFLSSA